MSYETKEGIAQMVNDFSLKIGNFVRNLLGTDTSKSNYQLYADTNGKLQQADGTTGAFLHAHSTDGATTPLKATQATSTLPVAHIVGVTSEGSFASTIVAGSEMTTRGFLRIYVESGDSITSTGFYYVPFGVQ